MKQLNDLIITRIKQKVVNDNLINGRLGATIKLKRKEKDMTLNDFSENYGISISYLSKIENNIMQPNVEYLSNLLEDLQINEKDFSSGLTMNLWYKKLVSTIIGLKSYKDEIKSYIKTREDFQAKILEFSLLVSEGKVAEVGQIVSSLVHNIELMQTIEFSIFAFSLACFHIKTKDLFAAGQIMQQISRYYIKDNLLEVWYYEILFELSLYQESYFYLLKVTKGLLFSYFSFGLITKIKKIRNRFITSLGYFLDPGKFSEDFKNSGSFRSYRLSLILYQKHSEFLQLEKQNDLAQLLYDEFQGESDKVIKNKDLIDYYDDPFEQALQEYFKYKYDLKRLDYYLKNVLFADAGPSQHYYSTHFLAKMLIRNLSQQYKYKECFLLTKKVNQLDQKRKQNHKSKNLVSINF